MLLYHVLDIYHAKLVLAMHDDKTLVGKVISTSLFMYGQLCI